MGDSKVQGITMVGSISHTSIAWIIQEGYFSTQIQLGHEMEMAESMTFSADGTGHRVSTIIHGMLICLWRTICLQIVEKNVQLDFLE